MKIIEAIVAWNLLSRLKTSADLDAQKYVVNARKALRPVVKEYAEFEKDARETAGGDSNAFVNIITPEQQRTVDAALPELSDDTLAALMAANAGTAVVEFDVLQTL